ncbi:hypothetical protein CHS0354_021029 [Potamilus streckersoni]|uniref:Uncharacterized protein n=1 Tax=Potamilus streckersoni TaxID=2493646 RepID=A0AAE0VUQ1_9BIVA|nr:hypothetical protein CHS0354_021029 [Potamilus streckersoni]
MAKLRNLGQFSGKSVLKGGNKIRHLCKFADVIIESMEKYQFQYAFVLHATLVTVDNHQVAVEDVTHFRGSGCYEAAALVLRALEPNEVHPDPFLQVSIV